MTDHTGLGVIEKHAARPALRTPTSAAYAGIAFSLFFAIAFVALRTAVPADPEDAGRWLTDDSRREGVLVALGAVPFAGIAFLWFVGVLRDREGKAEDKFFASIFLGSALLFVAMLFAGSAVAGSLVASASDNLNSLRGSDTWEVARHSTYGLMTVYSMRMAAVFTLSTSTILRGTGLAPRWLVASGYLTAIVLLVAVGQIPWIELVFPAWVTALSLYILVAGPGPTSDGGEEEAGGRGGS
jgi:hypothetical protein